MMIVNCPREDALVRLVPFPDANTCLSRFRQRNHVSLVAKASFVSRVTVRPSVLQNTPFYGTLVFNTKERWIYYDSTEPHGMKALSGKPARFLALIL